MLTQGHGVPSSMTGGSAWLSPVHGHPGCTGSPEGSSANDGHRILRWL